MRTLHSLSENIVATVKSNNSACNRIIIESFYRQFLTFQPRFDTFMILADKFIVTIQKSRNPNKYIRKISDSGVMPLAETAALSMAKKGCRG